MLPQAQKDIDNLQDKPFAVMKNKIVSLGSNPRPYGAIKLTAQEGYRIKAGDYRVLYRIDDKTKEVFMYRVIDHPNLVGCRLC